MMERVALDRVNTVTTLRRSRLRRVTPADSIATSVPVPIAIPTSAEAKAGASLMPSPANATTDFLSFFSSLIFLPFPAAIRRPSRFQFPLGGQLPGGHLVVSGDHPDGYPHPFESVNHFFCFSFDCIGDSDEGNTFLRIATKANVLPSLIQS